MSFRISDYTGHYPALIKLGLPILVSQLGMIVVGFADNIMVGHYSTPSLASASFVNNVFNIAILACLGFSYGLTPLVGAMFNQGRLRGIGALMRNGLMINLIFSVLLTLVMGVLYLNLHRLGQPEELLPIIRPYYLIYLAGVIPVALFNVFAQWSYAITNSRMPMWIILVANAANILGNWLLIFGNWGCPELGLLGAGISTLFARLLCMVAIIWIFFWHRSYREYSDGYRQARVTCTEMLHVFRTSMPISLQMTLETSAFSLCAIMAGWIDAISLAAFQIIGITGPLGFFCRLPADACAYGGFIPCIHIFRQRDNGGLYRRPCGEAGDGDAHIPASVISAWRCYADYLCQRPAWHFARHAHVLDCPCVLSVCRHSVHLYNGIYIGYGRLRYRA